MHPVPIRDAGLEEGVRVDDGVAADPHVDVDVGGGRDRSAARPRPCVPSLIRRRTSASNRGEPGARVERRGPRRCRRRRRRPARPCRGGSRSPGSGSTRAGGSRGRGAAGSRTARSRRNAIQFGRDLVDLADRGRGVAALDHVDDAGARPGRRGRSRPARSSTVDPRVTAAPVRRCDGQQLPEVGGGDGSKSPLATRTSSALPTASLGELHRVSGPELLGLLDEDRRGRRGPRTGRPRGRRRRRARRPRRSATGFAARTI